MNFPSLRSSARPLSDPSPDRARQLDRREADLEAGERALARETERLREQREDLERREREIEQQEMRREIASEQTNITLFDRRTPQQIQALADRVIRAGQKRRGELVDDDPAPRTETERLAAAVIAAGRRRRGEA